VTPSLVPLSRTPQALEILYELKRAALGPHVIARWGWDEALQRATVEEKWRTKTFFAIVHEGETIGTISIDADGTDGIEIGEFYIAPEFHGRGIGGAVLAQVLEQARSQGRAVRLQCLKWNPASRLYLRHGFRVVRESETHYQMEHASE
jgi:ribosomal protein S18 acetylase RimI-like enzyme